MDERPADVARRALRAAREERSRTPDGPAERRGPVPDDPAGPGSRPGDAARDALRRAVSARHGAVTADDEAGHGEGLADDGTGRGEGVADDGTGRGQGVADDRARHGDGIRDDGARHSDVTEDDGAGHGEGIADDGTGYGPSKAAADTEAARAARAAKDTEDTEGPEESAPRLAAPSGAPADGAPADPAPADGAPAEAAPTNDAPPSRPAGARPSEAAREALRGALARRAARAERSREEAAQAAIRASHRATPSPRRAPRPTPADPPAGTTAEHGGALTHAHAPTGAFRMPPARPDHAPDVGDDGPADQGSPEPWTEDPCTTSVPAALPTTTGAATPQDTSTRAATAYRTSQARGPAGSHAEPSPTPSAGTPHHTPQEAIPGVPSGMPRTMASPRRDGELRRTFPAFPAREAEGERFAETWWGDAWIDALEEGALDAARLARGRGYARTGHVDAVTVTPGLVLAYVQGSRPRPYRVQVRLRTLDDADWDRFLDAVAERPGHIAALLDKEMPQSLADCGVPLLPGPGDLEPHCSCPDRGHPCKHAAALCYQTARLLDADPFVLLLLRGRGERELLDALSRLNATRAARAAQEREPEPFPGVRAADALAESRRPPLPAPLPAPPHPEQPPVYPAAPGGPDPFALDQLATDAAARAHALLTTGRDPVGGLTLWQDAVRLAAARPGSGLTAATRSLYASLASVTGRTTAELARAVAAWRQGGGEGLAVLEEPWDPPAGRFDRARPLLLAADLPAFRPWRNRLTHPRGHLQLRLGRDGLWYAYESEQDRDDWWPRGTPDLDPVGALTGLGAPGAL
ncbi:SWIM zinc finger family protein [Streptomyces sp. NPDC006700]|uniref:SWIM zinc finger family protein n=1 Tax=unclassified Streptomyces TaxID=2593676 RepID=UPI0033CE66AD